MTKLHILFCALFLLAGCNSPQQPPVAKPKGELAFLLEYNHRLPQDVGFLTNHIMERRIANLLKENYEPFIKSCRESSVLVIDTTRYIVFANYYQGKLIQHQIIVDVPNDAIWVDYSLGYEVRHYADRPSLPKPEYPKN
jgi:hypothetical protein